MRLGRLSIVLLFVAARAGAQQTGATITGIVRDTGARPIAGALVTVKPSDRSAETDSAGRFQFTGLGADSYTVRARKIGYRPESWDVKLSKSGSADVKLELSAMPQFLDTVRVLADGTCPITRSIEAFLCRRQRPGGVFLDYTDIDDLEKGFVGELFQGIPGFRVDFRIERTGPVYTVHTMRMSGCITSLVDGRELTGMNRIPITTGELIALEVYERPDSVPRELQRYTWPERGGDITRSGRCALIVYWTNRGPPQVHRPP
jgi:hypothetical protein